MPQSMRNNKPEPERMPAKTFWLKPFKAVGETLAAFFLRVGGWWYCEGCDKLHSPLVVKYVRKQEDNHFAYGASYCSLTRKPGMVSNTRGE